MAATISVNFANEQDVYNESTDQVSVNTRSKKSVSAKLLQDVLGGGVVSGGYVKKTGDSMTGFLTLTGIPPVNDYHAATKLYVDSHAYTRRYYYECRPTDTPGSIVNGVIPAGFNTVSGLDLYTSPFYFFENADSSNIGVSRYLDVYRDGILQVFGQDYSVVNIKGNTYTQGATAIRFTQPFEHSTTVQVNIGNTGAYPVTFGVNYLSGVNGIRTSGLSGDLLVYAEPLDFAATKEDVASPTKQNVYVSPVSLSAFPLLPRASGLFRKNLDYNIDGNFKNPSDPYGSPSGKFNNIVSTKIIDVTSDPDGNSTPGLLRVEIEKDVMETADYNAVVSINTDQTSTDYVSFATVLSLTRSLSSFDFIAYDVFGVDPLDIYEISIQVY